MNDYYSGPFNKVYPPGMNFEDTDWRPLYYEGGRVIGKTKVEDGRVVAVIDDSSIKRAMLEKLSISTYSIEEKMMTDTSTAGEPVGTSLESPEDIPRLVDAGSLNREEIESRFGFHKATIEGPNASMEKHANLRAAFKNWAGFLSLNLPESRETSLMFTALEEASMWAHKAIAATDEIDPEA